MAEGWLKHKINDQNLSIEVDSAGTANYHVGEQPDKRMISHAKKYGVDISTLRARQFVVADFDRFDQIYVMDDSNLQNVIRLARNENDKNKVELLLNEMSPSENLPVPDPYYGGEHDFIAVIELLEKATDAVIKKYTNK
jgi:protein-tyrosine phosphatase